jgi:hypothetical protein
MLEGCIGRMQRQAEIAGQMQDRALVQAGSVSAVTAGTAHRECQVQEQEVPEEFGCRQG